MEMNWSDQNLILWKGLKWIRCDSLICINKRYIHNSMLLHSPLEMTKKPKMLIVCEWCSANLFQLEILWSREILILLSELRYLEAMYVLKALLRGLLTWIDHFGFFWHTQQGWGWSSSVLARVRAHLICLGLYRPFWCLK